MGKVFNRGACVVCLCEESAVMIKPCHHLCLCVACKGDYLKSSANCPICRDPIQEMVEVH